MAEFEARKAQYKVDAVKEMTEEFSKYDGIIFTNYRGMSVQQITELRAKLRAQESSFRVVKNRFAKLALQSLDISGDEENLIGPTALALTNGEDAANAVSKVLYEYVKSTPMEVKGAYIDGKYFDSVAIEAYSKLPTRLELIASFMGTLNAPLSKLARTLQALVDSKEE
ncbi:MAG: 50S ribosomal protein L10 [Sphaerochaetaceae bacterium]|jgi:large subunit ribosomal protein L10